MASSTPSTTGVFATIQTTPTSEPEVMESDEFEIPEIQEQRPSTIDPASLLPPVDFSFTKIIRQQPRSNLFKTIQEEAEFLWDCYKMDEEFFTKILENAKHFEYFTDLHDRNLFKPEVSETEFRLYEIIKQSQTSPSEIDEQVTEFISATLKKMKPPKSEYKKQKEAQMPQDQTERKLLLQRITLLLELIINPNSKKEEEYWKTHVKPKPSPPYSSLELEIYKFSRLLYEIIPDLSDEYATKLHEIFNKVFTCFEFTPERSPFNTVEDEIGVLLSAREGLSSPLHEIAPNYYAYLQNAKMMGFALNDPVEDRLFVLISVLGLRNKELDQQLNSMHQKYLEIIAQSNQAQNNKENILTTYNYLKVLGLEIDFSDDKLKKAVQQKIKDHHPDLTQDPEEKKERVKISSLLNNIKEKLLFDTTKKQYLTFLVFRKKLTGNNLIEMFNLFDPEKNRHEIYDEISEQRETLKKENYTENKLVIKFLYQLLTTIETEKTFMKYYCEVLTNPFHNDDTTILHDWLIRKIRKDEEADQKDTDEEKTKAKQEQEPNNAPPEDEGHKKNEETGSTPSSQKVVDSTVEKQKSVTGKLFKWAIIVIIGVAALGIVGYAFFPTMSKFFQKRSKRTNSDRKEPPRRPTDNQNKSSNSASAKTKTCKWWNNPQTILKQIKKHPTAHQRKTSYACVSKKECYELIYYKQKWRMYPIRYTVIKSKPYDWPANIHKNPKYCK